MRVYAQGTSTFSQPSRYHLTEDCWINVTGWKKQVPVHKLFTIDRDEAERRGWWLCPWCAPLPSNERTRNDLVPAPPAKTVE